MTRCLSLTTDEIRNTVAKIEGNVFLYGINHILEEVLFKLKGCGKPAKAVFDTYKSGSVGGYVIQNAQTCIEMVRPGDAVIVCAQRYDEVANYLLEGGLNPDCLLYAANDYIVTNIPVSVSIQTTNDSIRLIEVLSVAKTLQPSGLNVHITDNRPRIYAITYYGRSGSYLLSSMLDNHPQMAQADFEHVWYVIENIFILLRKTESMESEAIDFAVAQYAEPLFRETGGVEEFARFMCSFMSGLRSGRFGYISLLDLIYSITECYLDAYKIQTHENCVLIWQKHVPFTALFEEMMIKENWPIVSIVPVRRPSDALDSHIKINRVVDRQKQQGMDLLAPSKIYVSMLGASTHFSSGVRKIAVRFEDIHLHTEGLMRALCNEMNVQFCPCLLQSTKLGAPYNFTSGYKKPIVGTNPARAEAKNFKCDKTDMSAGMADAVQELLVKEYGLWGYPDRRSWFKRALLKSRCWLKFQLWLGLWFFALNEARDARKLEFKKIKASYKLMTKETHKRQVDIDRGEAGIIKVIQPEMNLE